MADVDHETYAVRMSSACGCHRFCERIGYKVICGFRLDRNVAFAMSGFQFGLKPARQAKYQ